MTYHIRIRSGPAHSSPVTRTVCVYEPTGAIQRGVTVRLHGVCQSARLIAAMASAGKVCISPYVRPQEQHRGAVLREEKWQILLSKSKPCKSRVTVLRNENGSEVCCSIF